MQDLVRGLFQTVAVLSRVIDSRDPWTAGHCARVSDLSRRMGAALGLSHDVVEGLRVGGMLHDIGKISIPIEILSWPGRLSPEQFSLVKTHAANGAALLADVSFPWPVAAMVAEHHERFDGSGYPRGLAGEALSLEGRIVAVADVLDSMVADRAYRRAPGLRAALDELESGAGTRYDPTVVAACVGLCADGLPTGPPKGVARPA
jgi:putative nucleotidyltransferase with HDIG domain